VQPLKRRPSRIDTLSFESCRRGQHELTMSFRVEGLRLTKIYHYSDVDLIHLEKRFGQEFLLRLYFHIMACEAIPLASLRPRRIDFGPFARFWTSDFKTLWQKIFCKVGAQWRYENDLPAYTTPSFAAATAILPSVPVLIEPGTVEALCFNGGGKDSLVATKLLEDAGISFSTYAYSTPTYGAAHLQHDLIDELLNFSTPCQRHRQWTSQETWDCSLLELQEVAGVKGLIQAETPISIFGALPVLLQYGYRYLILAHELSADEGNLRWERTGEIINHQWGKSLEAELLINQYIRRHLIANVSYFSILKPIHDVLIFNLLGSNAEAVRNTHSCNIKKPWCCECAKCAYVWVNYLAYLPTEIVNSIFQMNLFDAPATQKWFRQLLGLGPYKPFECVGEVPETRLAFEICRRKGFKGRAMDLYQREVPRPDIPHILDHYLAVRRDLPSIPQEVGLRVLPHMLEGAERSRRHILSIHAPDGN
jgi:hypothetical protein